MNIIKKILGFIARLIVIPIMLMIYIPILLITGVLSYMRLSLLFIEIGKSMIKHMDKMTKKESNES